MTTLHLHPDGDWIEHDISLNGICLCEPRTDVVLDDDGTVNYVVIHQNLDPRFSEGE